MGAAADAEFGKEAGGNEGSNSRHTLNAGEGPTQRMKRQRAMWGGRGSHGVSVRAKMISRRSAL
jgi:hypothetical protein